MPNTRDITCRVELYDPMTFMSGPLKQNDTTRLIINVYRDGRAYDLDGLAALLSAKLGDSPVYLQTSDYVTQGHTLIYNLAPPIVAQAGYIELEITLTDASDHVVSSFTLGGEVLPMLLNDEDIPEDERTEITDAARAAAQSVAQARAARDEAVTSAEKAEASAERAEGAAQSASAAVSGAISDIASAGAEAVKAVGQAQSEAEEAVMQKTEAASGAASEAALSANAANESAERAETAAGNAQSSAAEAESAAERAEQVAIANGYAVFDIGDDGCLYLIRTPNVVDILDFYINEKGELEVVGK